MNKHLRGMVLTGLCLAVPSALRAQGQASIEGRVTDTSGAVLPGVTVEASSPALIEKVRSVVTDAAGEYKIEQLRPGVYQVSFTLTGFNVVKREGIELTGSFVATVNVELRIGAIEQIITVTGESPIVDVKSVTQERVVGSDVLEAVPTGRTVYNLAILVPGANTGTPDVGGTNNLALVSSMSIHGGSTSDTRLVIDGASASNSELAGQMQNLVPDTGAAQELSIDSAADGADIAYGGLRINLVPKTGGNTFKGAFFGTAVNSSFQQNNYSAALQSAGLTAPNRLDLVYDFNPGAGGPIVQDKLWFYSSAQWQTNQTTVAGMYNNLSAGNINAWTYQPDLSHPGVSATSQQGVNTRLTWQASQKQKFSFYYDHQNRDYNAVNATTSPEASQHLVFPKLEMASASWAAPLTNRVLLNASVSIRPEGYADQYPIAGNIYQQLIPVTEQSTGLLYRGEGLQIASQPFINANGMMTSTMASLAYVTGAHAFKFGFEDRFGRRKISDYDNDSSLSYRFNNGIPNQIQERATPYSHQENLNAELGIYAQDKWTIKKLTVNAGARFDYLATDFPQQYVGPGPLFPTRSITFPAESFLSWKDLTPRLGMAYDLFGTGKTAIKVTLNKYVIGQGIHGVYGDQANPANSFFAGATRSWNDTAPVGSPNYYIPQCNLENPLANGQCGTLSDTRLGTAIPEMLYDPKAITGWDSRPNDWEFSTSVQHELLPRVSVNVGYFRRWYGNFTVVDNLAVAPTDFSPFQITAPVDPRLPGDGGYVVPGNYNLNPNKVGIVNNELTLASDFGNQIQHWNGVDGTVNVRPLGGVVLQGGFSTGRTTTDNCAVVSSPDFGGNPSPLYCHVQTPFLTQIKLLGTYTIPKVQIQAAAVFQSYPGPQILANYNATNAQVAPSLGRPLSGGAANVTVNLVAPGTMYGQRDNQLDFRLTKLLKFGRTRTAVNLDLYNALNANPVLTVNSNYAAWQVPQSILLARFAKISVQFDF